MLFSNNPNYGCPHFPGVPLSIAGRRPAIFQLFEFPKILAYECPFMEAPRFWRPPISLCHLHIVKTIPNYLSSLVSSVDRASGFRSEGSEFESHCCLMNLYQKLITIFLLIEEQLSMLQFFKSRTYTLSDTKS
jgi:hypothetical protein